MGGREMGMSDATIDYTDGEWYGATMGHFIGLLVDAGLDPAVMFRVVEDSEPDKSGRFVRRLEVIMLPNGYVEWGLMAKGIDRVHKTLAALMAGGVVK